MPGADVKGATPDDDHRRTRGEDDDYYHYYIASQRRVSRWIDQTKKVLETVEDEYPDSNIDFGEASTSSSYTRSRDSASMFRSSVKSSRTSEGTVKDGNANLSAKEGRLRRSKSRAGAMGDIDEDETRTNGKSHSTSRSRRKHAHEFDRETDVVPARVPVRYPDVRTRSVLPDNEPTFTEVMARLGTKKAAFGTEVASQSTTTLTGATPRITERTESRPKSKRLEPSNEFEISWAYVQPIVLILSASMLLVALVPSASAAVAIVVLIAVVYCTDLVPDLFSGVSSSSSSHRRKSVRPSKSSRRLR